ncbi:GNAT family N-acetyltransferase [Actinomadura montaniterrae]|uniref:GNAT family N-acetyltransferase n=1 Tax=Actinomadura montaniterrae TaxID=1803903 RepID=UPI00178C82E6|nr:GNAT family N-acetyltransferase [Actinomadura montaniterrae]
MVTKRPNPKKDKSARRRRPAPPPLASARGGGAALTVAGLAEGLVLASGVRIRMARGEDVETARRLVALTGSGVTLESRLADAVPDGRLAAVVAKGLDEGPEALTRELAVAASQGDGAMEDLVIGLSCVLVAEHPEHGVVGVLVALPPARVLANIGLPEMESLVGLLKVIKLKAVAVDPAHRSGGIAAALIATCRKLYSQLRYYRLYGQFDAGSGLETYYQRQGLTALKEGQGVTLDMFSVPAGIYTDPSERFFACDL